MPAENETPMSEVIQPMGIYASTGRPLHDPIETEVLGEWIVKTLGGVRRAEPVAVLSESLEFKGGLADGLTPSDLSTTGWAVLWAPNTDAAIKAALRPLLDERESVAGALYKEIDLNVDAGGQLESVGAFLERHGVSPGTVTLDKLPYYLMIVGDPAVVPFDFQTGLGVDHAVGRLWLGSAAAFERYALAAVVAEKTPVFAQNLAFFGPTNDGDPATTQSAAQLIGPLSTAINAGAWQVQKITGPAATKEALKNLVHGNKRVPLIFSASHGLGYLLNESGQTEGQGALLCERKERFSADDLNGAGDLSGLIWFAFACFGAGTPKMDNFPGNPDLLKTTQIAATEFQSALATRLLSNENGPALGFFGHVDLAWGTSFQFGAATAQIADFRECLQLLLRGQPMGHALHVLGERYASLSTLFAVELIKALQQGAKLKRGPASLLARYWTACMDARNYVLCGDPAAHLRS